MDSIAHTSADKLTKEIRGKAKGFAKKPLKKAGEVIIEQAAKKGIRIAILAKEAKAAMKGPFGLINSLIDSVYDYNIRTNMPGYIDPVLVKRDVFINGLKVACKGDKAWCLVHSPDKPSKIVTGSQIVFVNGEPAARVGDKVEDGAVVEEKNTLDRRPWNVSFD